MEGIYKLKKSIKNTKSISKKTTIDEKEVDSFNKISNSWWDKSGAFKPLHQLNPIRLEYIKDQLCEHFHLDINSTKNPYKKLKIADIGCGGGLITEPLSKLGAKLTGIDAGAENIKIAIKHAKAQKLNIDYRVTTAEELSQKREKFDVIIAMEILEHVSNIELFISSCCKLLKKGGIIIFSTLNRTPKSFMLGIIAAEYILKWLPTGTHDWEKFLKPSQIAKPLEQAGLDIKDISGMTYDPFAKEFKINEDDVDVNYLLCAVQPIK